ncbi:thioredoxin [uncultured Phascolarctobacterium sp.]|jgi:thioredoxin 1|uniref:thioredoxin n=1 Tax=uncultured Phascolarctobacterium sp. TaxID=512296 RepID=UPI0025F99F35|nr:thioredoxin [uncultured Phascolarctobacterium sp.]
MLAITKENFQAEVEQAQGTVLVDFWAQWCGPCRMQAPILEAFAGEHSDIKVTKCDVDENPELAEKFSIMSIPSLLVFKGGKLVKSAVGLHDKEALAALVR